MSVATIAAEREARELAERAGIDIGDDHGMFIADLKETMLRFASAHSGAAQTGAALQAEIDRLRGLIKSMAPATIEVSVRSASLAMIDVMHERARQEHVEGWTPEHDDKHDRGELAKAAACYLITAVTWAQLLKEGFDRERIETLQASAKTPASWPWAQDWWKPKDARCNLVKAAALIVAEIERLDRLEVKKSDPA